MLRIIMLEHEIVQTSTYERIKRDPSHRGTHALLSSTAVLYELLSVAVGANGRFYRPPVVIM